jgi:hypothetical protein
MKPTARPCTCGNHFRVRWDWQRADTCPGCCVREEEESIASTRRLNDPIEATLNRFRDAFR